MHFVAFLTLETKFHIKNAIKKVRKSGVRKNMNEVEDEVKEDENKDKTHHLISDNRGAL